MKLLGCNYFVGTDVGGAIAIIYPQTGKDFWRTINGSSTDKVIRPAP